MYNLLYSFLVVFLMFAALASAMLNEELSPPKTQNLRVSVGSDDGACSSSAASSAGTVEGLSAADRFLFESALDEDPHSISEVISPKTRALVERKVLAWLRDLKKNPDWEQKRNLALRFCAIGGFVQALDFLVEEGADLEFSDDHGFFPAIYAAQAGQVITLKHLLSRGAELHRLDRTQSSLFHHAAAMDHPNVIAYLIEGVDLEERKRLLTQPDDEGNTPLHVAAQFMSFETLRFLDSQLVDREIKNHDEKMAENLLVASNNQLLRNFKERFLADGVRQGLDKQDLSVLNTASLSDVQTAAQIILEMGSTSPHKSKGFRLSAHTRSDAELEPLIVLMRRLGTMNLLVDSDLFRKIAEVQSMIEILRAPRDLHYAVSSFAGSPRRRLPLQLMDSHSPISSPRLSSSLPTINDESFLCGMGIESAFTRDFFADRSFE